MSKVKIKPANTFFLQNRSVFNHRCKIENISSEKWNEVICSSTCNVINLLTVSLPALCDLFLKASRYLLTLMQMWTVGWSFCRPQNISEASQQNSAAAFPLTTEADGNFKKQLGNIKCLRTARPASSRSQRRDLRWIWKEVDWCSFQRYCHCTALKLRRAHNLECPSRV